MEAIRILKPSDIHMYQRQAILHQLYNKFSMLWLQPGLGKTIITLTSFVDLKRAGRVNKALIFGPLRVVQSVWETEARKWEHTRHLTFNKLIGPKDKRRRMLFDDADIYLCNYENMNWLAQELGRYYLKAEQPLPFQFVVYDEISKLKNSTTLRMAGGHRDRKDKHGETHKIKVSGWRGLLDKFEYRTGLTGTPATNGYIDLFGQYLAIDGGERLGEYVTHFKDSYFMSDYKGWSYVPTELGKVYIEKKISDITLKMDAADHLDMPKVTYINTWVDIPDAARKIYKEMERNMFARLDNGTELEVFSKSAISNKCLQIAGGAAYLEVGAPQYEVIHDAKLDALEDVIEEAAGAMVICAYNFRADAERIMKRFKKLKPVNLTDEKSADTSKILQRCKDGHVKLLIGHPASVGHGLDGLQEVCSIVVWFGLNWSLELVTQLNCRVDRQGQRQPVSIIRLLSRDTVDLAVLDAIERKVDTQQGLKAALDRYRGKVSFL